MVTWACLWGTQLWLCALGPCCLAEARTPCCHAAMARTPCPVPCASWCTHDSGPGVICGGACWGRVICLGLCNANSSRPGLQLENRQRCTWYRGLFVVSSSTSHGACSIWQGFRGTSASCFLGLCYVAYGACMLWRDLHAACVDVWLLPLAFVGSTTCSSCRQQQLQSHLIWYPLTV